MHTSTLEPAGSAPIASTAPAATPARRAKWTYLLPLVICATLSGVMTWINVGFVGGFLWRWLTGFLGALPVMALGLTLMSVYGPLLRRWMPNAAPVWHKLALALLMALTMETLVSGVVTLRNVGWAEGFAAAWVQAFVRSLPVGVTIGLVMGFVVRPRLQRLGAA